MEPTYLTTREVAKRFRVHSNTVVKWADSGRLPCVRTPGRHRRYKSEDVEALYAETLGEAASSPRVAAS